MSSAQRKKRCNEIVALSLDSQERMKDSTLKVEDKENTKNNNIQQDKDDKMDRNDIDLTKENTINNNIEPDKDNKIDVVDNFDTTKENTSNMNTEPGKNNKDIQISLDTNSNCNSGNDDVDKDAEIKATLSKRNSRSSSLGASSSSGSSGSSRSSSCGSSSSSTSCSSCSIPPSHDKSDKSDDSDENTITCVKGNEKVHVKQQPCIPVNDTYKNNKIGASDIEMKNPSNHEDSDNSDIIENTPPHSPTITDKVSGKSVSSAVENISMNTVSPVKTGKCKANTIECNEDKENNCYEYVENECNEESTFCHIIPYSPTSSENELNQERPQNLSHPNRATPDTVDSTEKIPSPNNIQQRPSVSRESGSVRVANINYVSSPLYSAESDIDLSDNDPTYDVCVDLNQRRPKNYIFPSSSSDTDAITENCTTKTSRKRKKNPDNWKQNKAKRLRNKGDSYTSVSKKRKKVPGRCLKPPCTDKCKHKCKEKIDTNARYDLFHSFWELGDLYKQRAFITSCMVDIQPKYKYTNSENPRKPNKAYYFTVSNEKVRVYKTFFKSTLDVSERMVYTTQQKITEGGFLREDFRGKHGNHKKLSENLVKDIKEHINSIPRIDSHYVRATRSRQYIDGGKNIRDLYNDFKEQQRINNRETGNYMAYYKIFTNDFNLDFHQPKKDMCDLCLSYQNLTGEEKKNLEGKYEQHLQEKELCRKEKKNDRENITEINKVAVYDLQAVLQCPRGDSSAFYYKSKLNSYNLTVTELTKPEPKQGPEPDAEIGAYKDVYSFFWSESDAKRGAVEIGSCIWKYLEIITTDAEEPLNVIFYSDNCAGQNKNKLIATLYMYAINMLNIESITHKFLIRGHTQNEADSVHSLIEREVKKNLKSGPIYTPTQYITLIKSSKKRDPPIHVHEMTFDSFYDLKALQDDWGFNYATNENGEKINWNDLKIIKVNKEEPFKFSYKTSYQEEDYKIVNVRNKRRKMKLTSEIILEKAYTARQEISSNKKKDLKELISKGLIPSFYANFYNSIFE